MTFTALEVIALIFAVISLIKIIVILVNKIGWYNNVVKPVYTNSVISRMIIALLAVVVFYYLAQELSIIQIFSVVAFTGLLMALSFLSFSKEVLSFAENIYKKKSFNLGIWIQIIIWLALISWLFYELFVV